VLLADAFPTGYHATALAQVSPGDSVAVFGAGAIGLLAAYCALHLRGASAVYVVDNIPARLEKAGEIGAVPIDFGQGDPVEQILEQRGRARKDAGATWRGEGCRPGAATRAARRAPWRWPSRSPRWLGRARGRAR
jgi:glutathione-independent formaldehyde dehydrogenase